MITRRSAFGIFAAAFAAPLAAYAQTGGLPSSTAPSNSEGTPSGGTGVISTTQVPAAGGVTPVSTKRHRRSRRHRHARRTH